VLRFAFVSVEIATPVRAIHLEMNGFEILREVESVERKFSGFELTLGRFGECGSETRVIERGLDGVLRGIDEDKFGFLRASFAVPEVVGLVDPVRSDFRDVDAVTEMAGKELSGALVVVASALRFGGVRDESKEKKGKDREDAAGIHTREFLLERTVELQESI